MLLGSFSSCTQTVEVLNLTKSCFGKVIAGKSYQHKGYTFSYSPYFPIKEEKKKLIWNKGLKTKGLQRFRSKKVKIERANENYIFDFTYQASNYLKMNRSQIYRYIKSGKSYKGWRIENI